MAKETIDVSCKACDLQPKNDSRTDGLLLEGGHNWTPTMYIRYGVAHKLKKTKRER
jgi:glycerol-3-phosphate dehydrogenase